MSLPNLTDLRRIDELTQIINQLKSEIESAKLDLVQLNQSREQRIGAQAELVYAEKLNLAKLAVFQTGVSESQKAEAEIKTQKDNLIDSSLQSFFKSKDFAGFVNDLISKLSQNNDKVEILASKDMSEIIGSSPDPSLKPGTLRIKTGDILYILDPDILTPKLNEILTRVMLGSEAV